jgi:hypothetical protein
MEEDQMDFQSKIGAMISQMASEKALGWRGMKM